MATLAQRIIQARKAMGFSQAVLAEHLGVSRSACGHWERGKSKPSASHLISMAQLLNVSHEWLATGRGASQMTSMPHRIAEEGTELDTPPTSLDRDLAEITRLYAALSKHKRELVIALIRTLYGMAQRQQTSKG